MIGILFAKARQFIRNPWTFLIFTGMSIGFALIMGITGGSNAIRVPVTIVDEHLRDTTIMSELKESTSFDLQEMKKEEMLKHLKNGKAEVGVILKEENYQVIVGVDSVRVRMVENMVRQAYIHYFQQQNIVDAANMVSNKQKDLLLYDMEESMNDPVFTVDSKGFTSSDAVVYNPTFQVLFGFSLFFVIYTIAYNVLPILTEKNEGLWDRIILSPVKKWEMYVANMLYSFFEGYLQVLVIFLLFRYGFGVNFNGRFYDTLLLIIPYVFAVIALALLITALVKNVQQFNAILPIIAVSMAMIGGAYWPIEIVESNALIALSKINPLTYGMEILNGAVVYNYSLQHLLYPISILILMGVVMIGIGIHLMERRHI